MIVIEWIHEWIEIFHFILWNRNRNQRLNYDNTYIYKITFKDWISFYEIEIEIEISFIMNIKDLFHSIEWHFNEYQNIYFILF